MRRLLQPFATASTYRTLVFLLLAAPVSGLWLALVFAGWMAAVLLAITPLIVPVLIGLGTATKAFGGVERALARDLLGLQLGPAPQLRRTTGFWRRGLAVLRDGARWREQAYFLLKFLVGGVLTIAMFTLLSAAVFTIGLPIYYRWVDSADVVWNLHVDSLPTALAFVPAGLVLLVAAMQLVRPVRALLRRLAQGLLRSQADGDMRSEAERRASRHRALAISGEVVGALNLLLIVIALLTGAEYFWPLWPLAATGIAVAIQGWVVFVLDHYEEWRKPFSRGMAIYAGVAALVFLYLVSIWAMSGGGYFWPVWPLIGLAIPLVIHGIVLRVRSAGREDLVERIEVLETSRADAVSEQETELRRIERDLHDGAQARLVALGMSLGMAEQKLASDPEAALELLADARRGAQEALIELRDLARGIHPPILTDRGLEAAVAALVDRTPLHVTLTVNLGDRPPPPVESAAYFVVAEALANASKYGHASSFAIRIDRVRDVLVVEVVDDGQGGADPTGNGLTGLARRVQALDGRLRVTSPVGGPTAVRAEIPCGS